MKFQELLYFYAVMSCPSNNIAIQAKRNLVKQQFNNILKNINNATHCKIYTQFLPSSDSAIKDFLGFSNQNDIELIKKIVTEITNNTQSITDAIKGHAGEDSINITSYTEYLDNQFQEDYPQISEYTRAFNEWQANVIHNNSEKKPDAPIVMFPHSATRLNVQTINRGSMERQRLLNTEEQNQNKHCCRIL